ncbi:MAG TPA: FadR family transcriptional regulator [Desulfobacteraceae bacterium]|nr:FadR family transcriptional regulator [Desulfobacteraceae bacterium]
MKKDLSSPFAPPKNRVFDEIIQHFKDAIAKGNLKSGDRLLSERDLSSRLGVSRGSLREALKTLSMFGVISSEPGRGAYVMSPGFKSLSSFFELMLTLKPAVSENILEVRMILECEAVRIATVRATPEEIAHIKNILDKMPLSLNGPDFGAESDFEFHNAIVRATHNDILIFIYEAIEGLLKRSHHERRTSLFKIEGIRTELVKYHLEVYKAIAERNAEKACGCMRKHFDFTNNLLEKQRSNHI